jgi:hypothetical protein
MFKKSKVDDDGFVLITVLGICFLAVMLVAALTALTISDLVSSARSRAVIEARNSAESSLDTLYAVVNRDNSDDLISTAATSFVTSSGESPISNTIETTKSSGGTYNTSTVITQVYEWSNDWYSTNEDGNIQECGLLTPEVQDNEFPCFKMRINRVTTNPFGNSGSLLNLTSGTTEADYQNANNARTEYVVDVVVRHACLNKEDIDNPAGCVFSRYQQKIRKREFIQHVVISETEEVAPQVYEKVGDLELQDRVKNLGNAYATNDAVSGNIHTNGANVFVCDGFGVEQNGAIKNWITSGYDSTGVPGSPTAAAASSSSNFTACNGSSGVTVPRFTASRNKFPLPKRIGDTNGTRLTSIAATENATLYVLSGTNIRVNFRFDRSDPDQANWDSVGMMNPVIDGTDRGWYPIPSNGVLSLNPDGGNGIATVSGQIKGKLTIFSTGSIAVANSLTYIDTTFNQDLLGLYANKDIILNCYNDGVPQTGQCNSKEVHGLLWAGNQTLVQDPLDANSYIVEYQGAIYNDHWNDSTIPNLDSPPILTIRGAMVSYHRGTFSAIESTGAGRVTSGWQKSFSWDPRFGSAQPPYMLRDALASFIRSTAKDIPCDDACN